MNKYAFPVPELNRDNGMTLLDYFAAQAVIGVIAKVPLTSPKAAAEYAYDIAEAMMEERGTVE